MRHPREQERAECAWRRASICPTGRLSVRGRCRRRAGRRRLSRRTQRNGELVGAWKLLEMPQCELLEKRWRGAIQQRAAESFAAPYDVNQPALVQRFENRARSDAPDLFDLRAANRLAIRDDCQCLQGGGGQPLWAGGELRALDCLGVFGPREDLPAARDLEELDTVSVAVVVRTQFVERLIQRALS